MFTIKGITYAEAGKVLVGKSKIGYQFPSGEFVEKDINLNDIQLLPNGFIKCNEVFWKNLNSKNYADWKKYFISRRYSNDDQIAIILNKDNSDEDLLRYNKMQEWRNWASLASKAILEKI